jgi:hypothetical protein
VVVVRANAGWATNHDGREVVVGLDDLGDPSAPLLASQEGGITGQAKSTVRRFHAMAGEVPPGPGRPHGRSRPPVRSRAADRRADGCVVVGRRVHRPALGMRIGPVAHAVLHDAAAPVAVVPHD